MAAYIAIAVRVIAVFIWAQSVHASAPGLHSSVSVISAQSVLKGHTAFGENDSQLNVPDLFEELPPACVLSEQDSLEYCVFTSTRFAGGRGISILARRDHAEALMALPAFTNPDIHSALGVNRLSDPPFYAAELPGRGVGLIANRTIRQGEWLMSSTPAFMITEDAHQHLSEKERLYFQRLAFERLPTRLSDLARQLYGQSGREAVDEIDDILDTNTFGLPVEFHMSGDHHAARKGREDAGDDHTEDEDEEEIEEINFKFLFPEIARFNHDCRPTGDYFFDSSILVQHIIAYRDVFAGEELTITYIPPLQKRRARQRALKRSWGFTCDCSVCAADADIIQASDARVEQIQEIQEELDDSSVHSDASPLLAERLIELLRQERLWTLMHGGYAAAAVEYSGVGDEHNAQRHAQLALERGVVCRGTFTHDPDHVDMLQLSTNPREHGSWNFRLSQKDR